MTVHFDDRPCQLGEGPLWHPKRQQLFWFDILSNKLLSKEFEHQFEEHVSAAGWVDENRLLIASETALFLFDLETQASEVLVPLEADNPVTRSNDGRADPQGGFWIGTMGKKAEAQAGAIYRYYRGDVRKLFSGITVSNSICFAPSGKTAYFTDTLTRVIQRVDLDADGWPAGDPKPFIDLTEEGLNPDGSVVDASGHLWNAQWEAARVACYDPSGALVRTINVPGTKTTCPAFGGPQLSDLYVTSALEGLEDDGDQGRTFVIPGVSKGQAEHRVILP